MAIGILPVVPESWVYEAFVKAELPRFPLTEWMRVRSKEEVREAVTGDVRKLRSVSPAAQRWIVGERLKYLGYADDGKFYFKTKHPDVYFLPARRAGKTWAFEQMTLSREVTP